MTRHIDAKASEDKSMTDDEVLRVLDVACELHATGAYADAWEVGLERISDVRAAVAALQVERDKLEALRGQVAELMKFREGGLPTKGWLRDNDQSRRVLHELNELLAMKNSGEF